MRKLRDIFYISANFNERYFIYYGMEFNEFIRYSPIKLKNILITDGNYISNNYNSVWCLEAAAGEECIRELCNEDIYGLGDFHWIDYDDETALNNCSPEEKAEVLYLSHFGKPLKSPFFKCINNNFFYFAHDDGWFCKLYCKDMVTFGDIIANKIIDSFSTNKRRKICHVSEEIKSKIFALTKDGLLIDFANIYKDEKCISLPFYIIGHYQDMDEMYNNLERNKRRAKVIGRLEYKNKVWKLIFEK